MWLFMPFLMACSGIQSNQTSSQKLNSGETTLITDQVQLSSRVVKGKSVRITSLNPLSSTLPSFTHLVDILPPVVNGKKLQASSTIKLDNTLYIAYNTPGSVEGGLDIVDISNLQSPVLVASLQSSMYQFNQMKSFGRALYLAGTKLNSGAAVLVVDIDNHSAPVISNELLVPGDVATSLDVRDGYMLVSSALNGGITTFTLDFNDPLHPAMLRYNPFPNALDVKAMLDPYLADPGFNQDVHAFVMGGDSDTHLYFMDKELQLNTAVSSAPSRMVIQGPLVYTNASSEGLKITEISTFYDGNGFKGFISSLPMPGTGSGIAELNQKVYAARGDGGVRFIDVHEPGAPQELGFFDFGDSNNYANDVWAEEYAWNFSVISIADASGGVRLVLQDTSNITIPTNWIQVYAKGTPSGGIVPKMEVYVNGVLVSTFSVLTDTFSMYDVYMPSPVLSGTDIKIRLSNATTSSVDSRFLSIGYVRIGQDYYYPWKNNTFLDSGVLAFTDSDNLDLYSNGYVNLIR